jgi:hypothetical protein
MTEQVNPDNPTIVLLYLYVCANSTEFYAVRKASH